MTKTCYFCEHETDCSVPYPYFFPITEDICKSRHSTNRFSPTEEWVYIENLEKENEELKRKIKSYQYEREKLHGYLAKSEVKE